jgi:hypothetical protein
MAKLRAKAMVEVNSTDLVLAKAPEKPMETAAEKAEATVTVMDRQRASQYVAQADCVLSEAPIQPAAAHAVAVIDASSLHQGSEAFLQEHREGEPDYSPGIGA